MASITLSRDGDVAVMTLSNPPLNLFGPDSFDELSDCVDEIAASDARAAVWRAEGEIFTGGVDVQVFADAVASGRGEDFPSLVGPVKRLEALEMPTARALPRDVPHRRARGCARLRHDLGGGVGPLRPGRARRRAHARRRRHPAHRGARGARAGARVRDDRPPV